MVMMNRKFPITATEQRVRWTAHHQVSCKTRSSCFWSKVSAAAPAGPPPPPAGSNDIFRVSSSQPHSSTTHTHTSLKWNKNNKSNVSLIRLYFCATFAWFFSPVLPFGCLHFIHALTNATDYHKYSLLPSADFDIAEVLVSFGAFIFS